MALGPGELWDLRAQLPKETQDTEENQLMSDLRWTDIRQGIEAKERE